ncbi:MAG: uracil phosphoribosyltransferase, partial [Oscillospiraceae bacterium]|nr:uracil phosphoribosyltransferase [Oscillospiraceae bacterium]
ETGHKEFRELVGEIAMFMLYEATRDLATKKVQIETPICEAQVDMVAEERFVIVPILRAGLGMVDGLVAMLPTARIGHIGMYRDHETHEPITYYCKMPEDVAESEVIVCDPMLATGGSAIASLDVLKRKGVKNLRFMCIVAAPEGVKALAEAHPDVKVYAGVLDDCLNENKYIVPGLGDAGDRIFGTK